MVIYKIGIIIGIYIATRTGKIWGFLKILVGCEIRIRAFYLGFVFIFILLFGKFFIKLFNWIKYNYKLISCLQYSNFDNMY